MTVRVIFESTRLNRVFTPACLFLRPLRSLEEETPESLLAILLTLQQPNSKDVSSWVRLAPHLRALWQPGPSGASFVRVLAETNPICSLKAAQIIAVLSHLLPNQLEQVLVDHGRRRSAHRAAFGVVGLQAPPRRARGLGHLTRLRPLDSSSISALGSVARVARVARACGLVLVAWSSRRVQGEQAVLCSEGETAVGLKESRLGLETIHVCCCEQPFPVILNKFHGCCKTMRNASTARHRSCKPVAL